MAQTYPPVNMGGTTDGLLVLSNGRFFRGKLRGAPVEATGEVIFNTSMTGYQEILTDPSYTGQIVTMTYPQIGNYGVNLDVRMLPGLRTFGAIPLSSTRS